MNQIGYIIITTKMCNKRKVDYYNSNRRTGGHLYNVAIATENIKII